MKNTTLCYLVQQGACLLLYRNKKPQDPNAGKWVGIGGRCEEGESPEDCLLREVYEETGLTLTDWRCRGLVTFVCAPWPTEYMHLYTATAATGTLHGCDEGTLSWVPLERCAGLPVWQGDRVFGRLLAERREWFSLKLAYEGEALAQVVLDGAPLPQPWY